MEQIEFKDINEFFQAILSYQKEINGKILRADQVPFIGFVVYREDEIDELGKYFVIKTQNVSLCKAPQELEKYFVKLQNYHISDNVLVFVDGELYTGQAIYNNYKGVGWQSGRTSGLFLEKKFAARYQDVCIVYLKYGKMRKCKFNPQGNGLKNQLKAESTYWDVVDMPGDNK
jgi:hypothetical protein